MKMMFFFMLALFCSINMLLCQEPSQEPASSLKWTLHAVEIQDASQKVRTEFQLGELVYVWFKWEVQEIPPKTGAEIKVTGENLHGMIIQLGYLKPGSWDNEIPISLKEPRPGEYTVAFSLKIADQIQEKLLKFTVIKPKD